MFTVLRLSAQDAALGWEKAGAFLLPAIARTRGLYLPEDVRGYVTDPASGWVFWLIAEGTEPVGAWTTQVKTYPRARSLEIGFAGGREMRRWYEIALTETENFARECGCDRLRCYGRRGWERFGYRRIGFVLERTLP